MRKIWNRPNQPVWSLVTKDESGLANFNICTYVTSISMEPKLMLIAIYEGTKTLANIELNRRGLLQLLSEDLAPVVRVCGQMSGHSINKLARLQKRYTFSEQAGFPYFTDAAGYMELQFTELIKTEGDHVLGVARVLSARNLNDTPILTTNYLKDNHYTR
jgi:flavin reductase (DIM6/NTAB) family NADH-FMN oxidoreductase RutF